MRGMILIFSLVLIFPFSLYAQDQDIPVVDKVENQPQEGQDKQDKQKTEKEVEEQNKEISESLDQALRNYEAILNDEKGAELRNTEKRIAATKGIQESNSSKLNNAENSLRDIKIEYGRRYHSIKKAYKEGHLSEKQYNAELKKLSNEFKFNVQTLSDDAKHYKGKLDETNDQLKTLEEIQRINKIMGVRENPKKKTERPLNELERFMNKVEKVEPFKLKNIFDVR